MINILIRNKINENMKNESFDNNSTLSFMVGEYSETEDIDKTTKK
jgi:hypothetical protein